MPYINRIMPNRGEPGDRFTVRIEGDVFSRVDEVSLGTDITVSRLNIVDDGTITIKIDISEKALPGFRDVAVGDTNSTAVEPNGFEVVPI